MRQLVLFFGGFVVLVVIVAMTACGGTDAPASADTHTSARCPFISHLDGFYYDLPERMSREQVKACQSYFARTSGDHRFAPGSPAFSTRYCSVLAHRHSACQQARVAVCRFAVSDGAFANLRACLATTPAVRRVVRIGGASISVLVPEPWSFWIGESLRLSADNEIRFANAFPNNDGLITFFAPTRTAWDSRASRKVAFPARLAEFLASNPYLHILTARSLHLPGITATEIDLVVRRADLNARQAGLCGEIGIRDEPCVAVTADSTPEGYTTIMLKPRQSYRLIDLHTASGRVVAVVDQFDRFSELAGAERIVRTLRSSG